MAVAGHSWSLAGHAQSYASHMLVIAVGICWATPTRLPYFCLEFKQFRVSGCDIRSIRHDRHGQTRMLDEKIRKSLIGGFHCSSTSWPLARSVISGSRSFWTAATDSILRSSAEGINVN